jgi:hypothetical protein
MGILAAVSMRMRKGALLVNGQQSLALALKSLKPKVASSKAMGMSGKIP